MNLRDARKALRQWSLGGRLRAVLGPDTTIIASNCVGSRLSLLAGYRFNSPTVDLFITPDDFLAFVQNLDAYLDLPFLSDDAMAADEGWPVAILEAEGLAPVRLHLQHYDSVAEAEKKWRDRAPRINRHDLIVCHTDKRATHPHLQAFDALAHRKIVFTHRPQPEIRSACYVPGYEDQGEVGDLFSEWQKLAPVLDGRRLQQI